MTKIETLTKKALPAHLMEQMDKFAEKWGPGWVPDEEDAKILEDMLENMFYERSAGTVESMKAGVAEFLEGEVESIHIAMPSASDCMGFAEEHNYDVTEVMATMVVHTLTNLVYLQHVLLKDTGDNEYFYYVFAPTDLRPGAIASANAAGTDLNALCAATVQIAKDFYIKLPLKAAAMSLVKMLDPATMERYYDSNMIILVAREADKNKIKGPWNDAPKAESEETSKALH